jgi:hypothetical protein
MIHEKSKPPVQTKNEKDNRTRLQEVEGPNVSPPLVVAENPIICLFLGVGN